MSQSAPYSLSPTKLSTYFLLDCERYLRWNLPNKAHSGLEGIPDVTAKPSAFIDALFKGGIQWEEDVLAGMTKKVHLADLEPGQEDTGSMSQRKLSYRDTIAALKALKPGEWIYQGTFIAPPSFYTAYGLDPKQMQVSNCFPDLITMTPSGKLRIIDIKASELVKITHRIQTVLYVLLLEHIVKREGILHPVDLEFGGIWLRNTPGPTLFELRGLIPHVEQLLSRQIPELVTRPAEEASWHLHFRCEWCQWLNHCREEAGKSQSISLMPYITPDNKKYLSGDQVGAKSLIQLQEKLSEQFRAESLLAGSANLRSRAGELARQSTALVENRVVTHPAASLALPKWEQIAVFLSLESEPSTQGTCSIGMLVRCPEALREGFGLPQKFVPEYFLAQSAEHCLQIEQDFIRRLHQLFSLVDQANRQQSAWKDQVGLQTYVFEAYERVRLTQLLLRNLSTEVQTEATELLFYFHNIDNIQADSHLEHDDPKQLIAYPLVVILDTLRRLVALPVPIKWRLKDVLEAIPRSEDGFQFFSGQFHHFPLSNYLDNNLVHRLWNGEVELIKRLGASVRHRLYGLSTVLSSLRDLPEVKAALVAWPPKFSLPPAADYDNPVLSRLAFITMNENLTRAIAARDRRSLPARQRELQESVHTLSWLEGDWWKVETPTMLLKEDDFMNHLLWPDRVEGEQAQLQYDDLKQYNRWSFKGIWLNEFQQRWLQVTGIDELRQDPTTGLIREVKLSLLKRSKKWLEPYPPQPEERFYLGPRYSNPNSEKIFSAIKRLNLADRAHFTQMLRDVCGQVRDLPLPSAVRVFVEKQVTSWGLTISQNEAFKAACSQNLTLVWGPPGTGKTHFLAQTIVGLLEAHLSSGEPCRILVTAFTHAAIDNVLLKVQEHLSARGLPFGAQKAVRDKSEQPGNSPLGYIGYDEIEGLYLREEQLLLGMTSWNFERLAKIEAPAPQLLIIDEASQMTVPEASQLWQLLDEHSRVLVVGDHYQLAPIIEGEYPEPEVGEPLLVRSIFEAFQQGEQLAREANPDARQVVYPLLECWRMCDLLTAFSTQELYTMKLATPKGLLGYHCANHEIAAQRLDFLPPSGLDESLAWLLDPAYPLVLCVLEGVTALRANQPEAELVAKLSVALRQGLQIKGKAIQHSVAGDRRFWQDGLFIVSPHHAQIQMIRRELHSAWDWQSDPFVDTVDKMQGQEAQAVIVSYGVSDLEAALQEKAFIYDRNRLNVAITRARSKCIVCLPQPLLEGHPSVLEDDRVAQGLAYMQRLADWASQCQELIFEVSNEVNWRFFRRQA
jgi:DNA replication ATP-dependent helicase Dna2